MSRPHSEGPLRPAELAEAAILADLTVALLFLGWIMPLGGVLQVLSVTPMAALGARHRPRAVLAATVAGSAVAFLLGGAGLWSIDVVLALIGLAIGAAVRKGWGMARVCLAVTGVWALVAAVTVAQMLLFANFRRLTLDQIRIGWRGVRNVLGHLGSLGPLLHAGDVSVEWIVRHWWIVLPAMELILVEVVTVVASAVSRPVIRRLERAVGGPGLPLAPRAHEGGEPQPVPVRLSEVAVRYPGADEYALSGVNLEVPAGSLVAVVGSNGSGKSTLARVVAGIVEPEGEVSRPGPVGLGRPGGTAVIFQRPESQVLGVRARDDVVWGFRAGHGVDADRLLAQVGLAGKGDEETSTLSGGQLQRLAIAAALARRPALLVSDESTSMLDPAGRHQVAGLLARLAREEGVTVVHVTHRPDEAAAADVVVSVDAGRVRVIAASGGDGGGLPVR